VTLDLDRSKWQRVKFSDFAQNVNDRVDDPQTAGVDRYVGLEHLDPGSMTVNRWGSPDQVEATKLRFKSGDVIFGRRRAYQKKVARADFAGICSAHAMVLRAKTESIDPDFLPVFLSSDCFLDRAIQISVGSLSPTVNWKTLSVQEFDLPPLDQQRRIADLLWTVEKYLDSLAIRARALADLLGAQREEGVWGSSHEEKALSAVVESCEYGTSERCVTDAAEERTPVLRIPNVVTGKVTLQDLKYLPRAVSASDSSAVVSGDFLVVRTNGNPDYVGAGALVPSLDGVFLYASYLLRIRVDPSILKPEFLDAGWKAQTMRRQLVPYIRSSAGNYNLSASSLLSRKFPVPSIEVQRAICSGIRDTETALDAAEAEVTQATALRGNLISKVFGGGQ